MLQSCLAEQKIAVLLCYFIKFKLHQATGTKLSSNLLKTGCSICHNMGGVQVWEGQKYFLDGATSTMSYRTELIQKSGHCRTSCNWEMCESMWNCRSVWKKTNGICWNNH
jgi:hypothetical protein